MRPSLIGAFCALGLSVLGGCVSIPGTGLTSATDVARDAAAINDAYSRGASGQILLNVLRSRDRWPRQYVNLNGITNQPTATIGGTLTLDPIPLGTSVPFDDSTAEFTRSHTSNYNYGITPMATADITRAVLNPVKRDVFAHYWNSRWARDVLLLVMAENIRRYNGPTITRRDEDWQDHFGGVPAAQIQALIEDAAPNHHWLRAWPNSPTDDEQLKGDPCEADADYTGVDDWPADEGVDQPTLEQPFSNEQQAERAAAQDAKNKRCVFFQIVHRMFDYAVADGRSYADIRLSELPRPTCRETRRVPINAANERLIRSISVAAAASNGRLVVRMEPGPTSRAAQQLVLARCPAEPNEPVLLEILTHEEMTDTDGTKRQMARVEATYLVQLRSLDDMIYAMGRLLRSEATAEIARTEPCHRSQTNHDDCVTAPLFTVERGRHRDPLQYAGFVDYRGQRYLAGPAVANLHEVENERAESNRAETDASRVDRTATVLTLLSQLFALNFSPGADAAAPSRVLVQ